MRIAVFGAGAVGGYFGAKLAAAANQVAFIARGAHLAAMKKNGLRIDSGQENLRIREALFTDNPAAVGAVDFVLFCVKSYDTESAAQAIRPLIGNRTLVLSLQNGIDNPEKIARTWGEARTLAGVVYIGAELSAAGRILHSSGGRIVFGSLDGRPGEATKALEALLSTARIPNQASTEIRTLQWAKLLWNAPFCAIACLLRATVKEIVESEPLAKLAVDCMLEVREAAKVQGVELERELIDKTLQFSGSLGAFKPSMLQDLEAGKPLEFEAFNGIVVKTLRAAAKDAPINRVLYAALQYLDQKNSG